MHSTVTQETSKPQPIDHSTVTQETSKPQPGSRLRACEWHGHMQARCCKGLGFRIEGLGFKAWSHAGIMPQHARQDVLHMDEQALGFMVEGLLGFRIEGLGLRVEG